MSHRPAQPPSDEGGGSSGQRPGEAEGEIPCSTFSGKSLCRRTIKPLETKQVLPARTTSHSPAATASRGLQTRSSLKTAHRAVFRALEPPDKGSQGRSDHYVPTPSYFSFIAEFLMLQSNRGGAAPPARIEATANPCRRAARGRPYGDEVNPRGISPSGSPAGHLIPD